MIRKIEVENGFTSHVEGLANMRNNNKCFRPFHHVRL
jgi:hypothetical protein